MRIAAICLPDLHVEVVRATASARAGTKATASDEADAAGVRAGMPLAIVVAPAPLTEAKLLGNTRLDVVSREARALGVHPGQTIASARARAANLAVRVVRPEAVHGVLARLAEVSLAFGATVSFSGSNAGFGAKDGKDAGASVSYGDVVWVDVTGCAHLHAPRDRDRTAAASAADGEAILAARLASVF